MEIGAEVVFYRAGHAHRAARRPRETAAEEPRARQEACTSRVPAVCGMKGLGVRRWGGMRDGKTGSTQHRREREFRAGKVRSGVGFRLLHLGHAPPPRAPHAPRPRLEFHGPEEEEVPMWGSKGEQSARQIRRAGSVGALFTRAATRTDKARTKKILRHERIPNENGGVLFVKFCLVSCGGCEGWARVWEERSRLRV